MPATDSDVATAASRFHEDIPHRFQVSLTMSMETRDSIRAVRDAVNEACDEQVFTTDDVVQFALRAAASCHAQPADEQADGTGIDDELLPLAGVVREVLDADGDGADPAGHADE